MKNKTMIGHILAFVCIMIWGSTFVSSKILLDSFTPIELLFIRFLIGFLALCILSPKILKLENRKDEIWYILSGLTGVFLYYFLESTALVYAYATNVGVIISIAPFFTSILAYLCFKDEPFKINFAIFNILIRIEHCLFFRNIYGQNSFIFYTTFTPTNRYGSCRIPDGNGPEGSIAVNGIPFSLYLAFSFKTETRTTSL
jgi:uncharacterized membrane protein